MSKEACLAADNKAAKSERSPLLGCKRFVIQTIIPFVRPAHGTTRSSSVLGFWLLRNINVDDTNETFAFKFFFMIKAYSEIRGRPDTKYTYFSKAFAVTIIVLAVFSCKNTQEL